MAVVNKFNVNKQEVTLDADIIENMSANDVSYDSSTQYDENTVGEKLSELEKEVIYNVTENNDGVTFASLSELLSSENLSTLIPISVRCGGMSIRFVQSSNNKYVQYHLITQTFSTNLSNWQKVSNTLRHLENESILETDDAISVENNNGDTVILITEDFVDAKNLKSNGEDVLTDKNIKEQQITESDEELIVKSNDETEEYASLGKDFLKVKNLKIYDSEITFKDVLQWINNQSSSIVGVLRQKDATDPSYPTVIGDVDTILNHFKLGLVKDGVLQYYVKQTDILSSENERFASVLNGSDGDLLIINDVSLYYIIYSNSELDMKLFSTQPFTYNGIVASMLPCRGDAPSLGYIENINGENDKESALGNGKILYSRNPNNVGSITPMRGMIGKYVPSGNPDNITYSYDDTKQFIESGSYRPSSSFSQNVAEKAALNKNISELLYTNKDALSREILIALMTLEYHTNYFTSILGNPYTSAGESNELTFTTGKSGASGCRIMNPNTAQWDYYRLNTQVTYNNSGVLLFELLSNWRSVWEIMEQHLVLSYAVRNNIVENTWFVYNENEYKYTCPIEGKNVSDGIPTCILYKKFKSKVNGITYNNVDYTGQDIEFVITSSMYRGWIIDVSPHYWLTGINCVIYGDNLYKHDLYIEHDYRKYIMNKNYSKISIGDNYDFEKIYQHVEEIIFPEDKNYLRGVIQSNVTNLVPKVTTREVYDKLGMCMNIERASPNSPVRIEVSETEKTVTGVKEGYGPTISNGILNFIYLNHPRTYNSALAGYASFVCQKVTI